MNYTQEKEAPTQNDVCFLEGSTIEAIKKLTERGESFDSIMFLVGFDKSCQDGFKVYKTDCPFEKKIADGLDQVPTVLSSSYCNVAVDEESTYYITDGEEPSPFIEHDEIYFEEISLSEDNPFVQEDDYTRIAIIEGNIYFCVKE